jgi:hypothetical protein
MSNKYPRQSNLQATALGILTTAILAGGCATEQTLPEPQETTTSQPSEAHTLLVTRITKFKEFEGQISFTGISTEENRMRGVEPVALSGLIKCVDGEVVQNISGSETNVLAEIPQIVSDYSPCSDNAVVNTELAGYDSTLKVGGDSIVGRTPSGKDYLWIFGA